MKDLFFMTKKSNIIKSLYNTAICMKFEAIDKIITLA